MPKLIKKRTSKTTILLLSLIFSIALSYISTNTLITIQETNDNFPNYSYQNQKENLDHNITTSTNQFEPTYSALKPVWYNYIPVMFILLIIFIIICSRKSKSDNLIKQIAIESQLKSDPTIDPEIIKEHRKLVEKLNNNE